MVVINKYMLKNLLIVWVFVELEQREWWSWRPGQTEYRSMKKSMGDDVEERPSLALYIKT